MTLSIEAIAHHEAGHACLDIVFDHDIESLTIIPDGDAAGSVVFDRSGDDELRYADLLESQVIFERRIMSAMAGEIAQRRFDPTSVEDEHGAGDRKNMHDYLDCLHTPTQEIRDAYQRLLELRTAAILDRYWDSVERIAAALLAKKTLTPEEAREAFADPRLARFDIKED